MSLIERLRHRVPNWRTPGLNEALRNPDGPEAATQLEAMQAEIERLREAVDRGLDWVTDVVNEAQPGSIMHNNAVRDAEIMTSALDNSKEI